MKSIDQIVQKLRDSGAKVTPQRIAILKSLQGNTSHPGAHEIYHLLKDDFPSLSKATVYNTLDMLSQIGEVRELTIDRAQARFDPDMSFHDHILCTKCRKVEDVHRKDGDDSTITAVNGYEVLGASMQFYGICAACREPTEEKVN